MVFRYPRRIAGIDGISFATIVLLWWRYADNSLLWWRRCQREMCSRGDVLWWRCASGSVLALVEADDDVGKFLQDMDEGRQPDIPVATTDDGGDALTRYALEWRGRLLSDGQKFSDLGVPQGAEFRVHLLVIHHDSVVTRPLPHRRRHTATTQEERRPEM